MTPSILSLATAVPPHVFFQEEVAEMAISVFGMKDEKAEFARRIYQNSAIKKRHSIIGDFHQPRENWEFWGTDYPQTVPGMSKRNLRYKEEAPKLAEEAARQALAAWGGDPSSITHLISVSCTGVMAPGIEFYLMQKLGLRSTINRLGINFMGCFGAFKGLAVAAAFANENPKNRILCVCTELCSLHLQANQDGDAIMGNSLFSDGSAAAIIGSEPMEGENSLWEIIRFHSFGFKNSLDKMSWEASDQGLIMRLSHTVPVLIGRQIKEFADALLQKETSIDQCQWAIHPGGKSILQAIEKCLKLQQNQTFASWKILNEYGNMSSATFLFVLDELARQGNQKTWTAGVGFGPGLSAEGILLAC